MAEVSAIVVPELLVCKECGSARVHVEAWIDPYTCEVYIEHSEIGSPYNLYCTECELHGREAMHEKGGDLHIPDPDVTE